MQGTEFDKLNADLTLAAELLKTYDQKHSCVHQMGGLGSFLPSPHPTVQPSQELQGNPNNKYIHIYVYMFVFYNFGLSVSDVD